MASNNPNVILIYADDLGHGMLSCYGQKQFRTPHIDALAENGLRFVNAHGCHMCAPARASLLCGIHDCHSGGWSFTKAGIYEEYARNERTLPEIYELLHNTGITQRSGDWYLPMVFAQNGYVTGQIGKLEWGFATTGDEIRAHGWDYHYGYYDHGMCHGYYPPFVFEDGKRVDIPGNTLPDCGKGPGFFARDYRERKQDKSGKAVYSQDLYDEKIVAFLETHRDEPFFLYHPSQLPHHDLSIPEIDQAVADNPALNDSEKEYASMVLRLDKTVGRIVQTLKRLDLYDNTIVVFSSDNGHFCYYAQERTGVSAGQTAEGAFYDHLHTRYTSGAAGDIFDGNGGLTGCKLTALEGGTRVPLIFSCPARIPGGRTSERLVAGYDFMSTMAELSGGCDRWDAQVKDGLSYRSELTVGTTNAPHDHIVFAGEHGPAILTADGWKLRSYLPRDLRYGVFGGSLAKEGRDIQFELYHLPTDEREETNLYEAQPERAAKLLRLLLKECDGNLQNGTTQAHFAFTAN